MPPTVYSILPLTSHPAAVLTQEHLTEALRRLRRNTSDTNVDRRLVTNVLLQFIATPRADPKRFEMLSLLATILSWEDSERERAGLQRAGGAAAPRKGSVKGKEADAEKTRTQEEQDTFNEVCAPCPAQNTNTHPSAVVLGFVCRIPAQGSRPGAKETVDIARPHIPATRRRHLAIHPPAPIGRPLWPSTHTQLRLDLLQRLGLLPRAPSLHVNSLARQQQSPQLESQWRAVAAVYE